MPDYPPYLNKVHVYRHKPDYDFGQMEDKFVAHLWITLHERASVGLDADGDTAKLAHSRLLAKLVRDKKKYEKELAEYKELIAVRQAQIELIEAWQEQDDGKYTQSDSNL